MNARNGHTPHAPALPDAPASSDAPEPSVPRASLSLVVPAWNEEEVIEQAIREATESLAAVVGPDGEYEVLVVDDGSVDRTAELVLAAAKTNPRVRLIKQPRNLGYGAALRAGFEAARCELVGFTDADCQFELSDLAYMLPLAERFDLVYGYRIDRKDPEFRRFMSWGYNQLIRVMLGTGVRDVDCALKIFRRGKLGPILAEAKGFFANTEMLSRSQQLGLTIVEVGVRHRPRAAGGSKVSMTAVPKTLASLLPYWWSEVLHGPDRPACEKAAMRGFWPALAVLSVLAAWLLFPRLAYPLIEPDEARYGEIAREMLVTGDWLVPRLHGEPYYDKPPLFYWLCAASFKLFGVTEQAARLVPAAATFLTILATFLFARRSFGTRPAAVGAGILTLSLGVVYCGRFLILDSVLTLFVTLSLYLAWEAFRTDRLRWGWFLGSALCCGAGVLTKGPVAVALLLPPVVAAAWLDRKSAAVSLKNWAIYAATAAVVAVPWFVAVIVAQPAFAKHFFWDHNVARFLAGSNHSEPFWFYLPVVALSFAPWSLLLVPFAVSLFDRSERGRARRPKPLGFFLLWAAWCLAFFSLSKAKLPPYILPACPAIAVLLGHYLDGRLAAVAIEPRRYFAARYSAAAICWGALGVGIASMALGLADLHEGLPAAVVWGICLVGLGVVWRRLPPKPAWGLCAVALAVAIAQTSQTLLPRWAEQRSLLASSPTAAAALADRSTAAGFWGDEWGSVPFDLDRDDMESFRDGGLPELVAFLGERRRAHLFIKPMFDVAAIREALPPGTRLDLVTETGGAGGPKGRLYLVQLPPAQVAARPNGLRH